MDCMRSGFRAGRTRTDASSDTDKMLSETLTGTAATWVIDWTRQHCHRGRLTRITGQS